METYEKILGHYYYVFDVNRILFKASNYILRQGVDQTSYVFLHGNEYKVDSKLRQQLTDVQPGDLIYLNEKGNVSIVLKAGEKEVTLFVTNACNSNCIMCPLSEHSRRNEYDQSHYIRLIEYIDLLPKDISFFNITGGEPTLAREYLIEMMRRLRTKYNRANFQFLTNGRSMADDHLVHKLLDNSPRNMLFAIPLHAHIDSLHDYITRADGSFSQTQRGIKNLIRAGQRVEIRIVLSKLNGGHYLDIAKYIADHYQGCFCVTLMAMEMMGNAMINREKVWQDLRVVSSQAKAAIDYLVLHGIDVRLYNFPLCYIDKKYWPLAKQSITSYKIRYLEKCNDCKVRDVCGGWFNSTMYVIKPEVYPIL